MTNPIQEISIHNFNYRLKEEPDSFQLIDVRNPDEYALGNLGGQLMPLPELTKHFDTLDKEKDIIVHCQHGISSAKAAQLFQAAGFKNVWSLKGGYAAWVEER